MEQTKFTRFKRIITKNLLVISIVLLLTLCGCFYLTTCSANTTEEPAIEIINKAPSTNIVKNDNINVKDSIQDELIKEVSKYVRRQAPKSHQFIPKYLVQAGLTNNIDICFIMAQTQIETNFGTTGAGRESSRRSMFGVVSRRYPNYEDAINHYCQVLKKYYLVKGRTEQHLMAKYVTGTGGRYAANPRYEIELSTAYNQIKRTTNIYKLQKEYNKIIS
jgi:flagellum-specific peptidoglycan hydrolase FlgJ